MNPDLVMQEKKSRIMVILDTKFTAHSLVENPWNGAGFNSSHLYQIYAYLKSQEYISNQHRHASGILLYPTVRQPDLSETIELQDLKIRVECVDLTAPWQAIERRLIDLISN